MTDAREFDDLAFKYFAAGLTPPESERFQALLRERPELRRRLLQESVRVGAIGEWAAEQLVSAAPKPQGPTTTRRIALAAVAAILVAAVLVILLRETPKATEVVVVPPPPRPAPQLRPELLREDPPVRPAVTPAPAPTSEAPRPAPEPKVVSPLPDPAPVPTPKPVLPPTPPPPPEPKPVPPKEPARSEVMIARVDEVHGDAVILADGKKFKATANAGLPAGTAVRTSGPDAVVSVVFPDRTRVVLGGDTEITGLRGDGGKQLTLVHGVTALDVTPQPREQPLQLLTPHGAVTVLGTSLTVRADASQVRLDVEEGKVRLETPQGRNVIVSKDQSVEAAAGRDLAVKRIPPPDVMSDLVGHWKFDEASGNQAYDASPHRHHAAIDGATRVRGKSGGALRFDGVDDFVRLPGAPVLGDLQEGDYTLSGWCSPAEPPRGARYILLGKVGYHIGLTYDDDNRFEMWHYLSSGADGGGVHARSGPGQAPGEFHHVAGIVSRSKGMTQIYVDGRLEGVNRWALQTAPRDYGGRGWTIGMARENNVAHGPAAAVLDDVRIYKRALSPRDVAFLAGVPYGVLSRVR